MFASRKSLSAPRTKESQPARTLLVVDDDSAVRQLLAQILDMNGYQVLQAEDATDALRVARVTPTIHLLVTDYSMPGRNGLTLTREFREVHPQTPVLMVSGSRPEIVGEIGDLECFELLDKPFVLDDLIEKVRTLLDVAASPPRRTC